MALKQDNNSNFSVSSFVNDEKFSVNTPNNDDRAVYKTAPTNSFPKGPESNSPIFNPSHLSPAINRSNNGQRMSVAGARRPILSISHLTKVYGQRYAVNNISLNLYQGQILGFLGANGAGKSTTIKMITGLAKITSGDIYINGFSVKTSFEQAIKSVGAMIEIPQFYPYLSGYNNLKYFAKLSGKVSNERIQYVASLVGLSNRIKDKVSNYSLGMKQRLGVAQALLHSPKILILDEPTNGLDANGVHDFRLMLKSLAKTEGISILISSHILSEMENLCDMVCIIDRGRIVATSSMEDIKKSCTTAGSIYIKCNAPNLAGKLIMEKFNAKVKLQGNKVFIDVPNATSILPEIIVELTQKKVLVFGAGEVDYSLEDVFLNFVGHKADNSID